MKVKLLLFIVGMLLINHSISCQTQKDKMFKDLFGVNAIVADQEYYSQAIIQFQVLEKLMEKYGSIYHLLPKENPALFLKRTQPGVNLNQFDIDNGVPTMVLFGDDGSKPDPAKENGSNKAFKELYDLGVDKCLFQIPMRLDDLDSGFQFNHYIFNSSNSAALKAFGIANDYNSKSLYIVIDYIQYKDNLCTGVPKIRYGVGIRSEIRISNWSNKTDIKESSLASLAANAEINSLKVNITVKTIGITGLGSKLSIPNNTSFNVDTYSDYQKIIDFIRTFREAKKDKKGEYDKKSDSTITFKPQLIPIMDEYRTSISQSFEPYYYQLKILDKKLKQLKRKEHKMSKTAEKDQSVIERALTASYKSRVNAVLNEIAYIENRKNNLSNSDVYNSDLKRFVSILAVLNGTTNEEIKDPEINEKVNTIRDKIKIIEDPTFKTASDFEREGYIYLLQKNITKAVNAFKKAENTYPGFHSVYELSLYLEPLMSPASPPDWNKIYNDILYTGKLNYKMPTDIRTKIEDALN